MVSYAVTGNVLQIFVDNTILAEIEDGEPTEKFVEEVLSGMGYQWLNDGRVVKCPTA